MLPAELGGGVKSEGVKSELALKSYCLESSLSQCSLYMMLAPVSLTC